MLPVPVNFPTVKPAVVLADIFEVISPSELEDVEDEDVPDDRMNQLLDRMSTTQMDVKNLKEDNPVLDLLMFILTGAFIIIILDLLFRYGQRK